MATTEQTVQQLQQIVLRLERRAIVVGRQYNRITERVRELEEEAHAINRRLRAIQGMVERLKQAIEVTKNVDGIDEGDEE